MPRERSIIFFTCAAHALTHLYIQMFQAIIDPMRESFGIERDELTFYATLSAVLFGVGALPAGWLGDRYGEKRLLVAFFFLTAIGAVVLGLAGGLVSLAVGMVLIGLGTSIFHPVGNALISKGMRHPGKAMGMNGLWGSLGTAFCPVWAAAVTHLTGNWRWSYLALAAPMALFGLWLAKARIETLPEAEQETAIRAAAAGGGPTRPMRIAIVSLLLLAMTCGGLYFHLITTMLPTHLGQRATLAGVAVLQSSLLAGGTLSGIVYLIGGAGQLLSGHLVHTREGRGLYVLALLVATPLVLSLYALHGAPLVLAAGVMAVFIFAVQPLENVLLSRYSRSSARGFLFGLKFVLAFGVGGLGTRLAGAIERHWDVASVFLAAGAFTGAAFCAALGAWCFRRGGPR
jgi:predicted MFS family arabinose efflux permease